MLRHNSTIPIKPRPCKSCGRVMPIFSKGRCLQCAKVEDFHAKYSKMSEIEDDGLPELIDRLDGLVSKYVRFSAPRNKEYLIECYTCGDWRMAHCMDAGHYITRACMYLRFDVSRNIRPQCPSCNRPNYGMAQKFRERLELEMPGVTDILQDESRIIHKWTREELKSMIIEYSSKLKLLGK